MAYAVNTAAYAFFAENNLSSRFAALNYKIILDFYFL